jgi:uncharacterized repeat protein (TIGR01451 family)
MSILALTIALMTIALTASPANATYATMNKQHTPGAVNFNVGNTVTFTVTLNTLTDVGGSAVALRDLSIQDDIPAGLTYVVGSQSSTPAASFTAVGQKLTWNFGAGPFTTAPQATVSFSVTVDAGASGTYTNHANSTSYEVITSFISEPGTTDSIFVNPPATPSPPPPTPTLTPRPSTVGGESVPLNILQLISPYIVVAALGAIAVASLVLYKKRVS